MDEKKTRVSKEQFAKLLFWWLAGFISEDAIKKMAKDLKFRIHDTHDSAKFWEEWLILNLWLTVRTCEMALESENVRNQCLDMFYHLVYDHLVDTQDSSFRGWMLSIIPRYEEYSKARETEHPRSGLWVVATKFGENLFGSIRKDLEAQMALILHQGLFVEHLGKAIQNYDIE